MNAGTQIYGAPAFHREMRATLEALMAHNVPYRDSRGAVPLAGTQSLMEKGGIDFHCDFS